MDGIALSWILRIQELQLVLANTQRELQAQRTRQHEAQALLGQTLQDQDKVQQAALEVQLQKAKLHFAIFKLETKGSNKPTDHTLSSNSIACEQSKLDQVITKKQRIAAKMKQEQKESQEFSKLMKGLQMDKEQSLADLQLKLSEVHPSLTRTYAVHTGLCICFTKLTLMIVTPTAKASDRACAPEGCVTQAVTE
ncbi:TPA: hypothetical protein ACH3X2_013086 [Trebouxia sp. C0005]